MFSTNFNKICCNFAENENSKIAANMADML